MRSERVRCWLVCALVLLSGCVAPPPDGAEPVVVVHGLGRTPASMWVLEYRLENAGYRVVNFGYPSRSEPIDSLVDLLADEVQRCCEAQAERVHFVTHSMGGVLVRSYLSQQPRPHQGRVVMLSPPSQGSELIDTFEDSPLLRLTLGPAASELGTDSTDIAARLGAVRFSLGVITGDVSWNPLYSWLIPGPDDGKVGVDNARVEGAADFLVLPTTHTFIMNRVDVADATIHFLQNGRFE
ncbi:MAG: alpha/beta fold hydrolase [Gemmatimonadota bacterium]|nr:alpha/beta fold hydrolase [Gemmatimonadota bacterium]MDH3422025.1 alpha/beta fold hydrolase [Gemmatimonadota bacterium]